MNLNFVTLIVRQNLKLYDKYYFNKFFYEF